MIIEDNSKKINKKQNLTSNPELDTKIKGGEVNFENNIRPLNFDDYIGQTSIKETLKITIAASKKRNSNLDHLLFYGPPGLGKTTLASIIAHEMGVNIKITSAPALERPRDIIGILMQLKEGEILFIDEIHRLNKIAEEILYPAMEDFVIDLTTGKNASSKSMRIPIAKFCLIGATTKAGSLSGPLRDRFGIIHRLEFYTQDELKQIIKRTAKILKYNIEDEGAKEIALRARCTPRIANRLVKRCADWALVKGDGTISKEIANSALNALDIDKEGLDITDRNLLKLLITSFKGGPVGIETLAVALGEDIRTIEDVYEPYLIQKGFLARTPRGRIATELAYKHLDIKMNSNSPQMSLFS
ncbi:Holliday junction branch migration DNA helicase RuvB [bacterium]|nr:Holliday junction branch migration DNA helicase RuvB [bacterium]